MSSPSASSASTAQAPHERQAGCVTTLATALVAVAALIVVARGPAPGAAYAGTTIATPAGLVVLEPTFDGAGCPKAVSAQAVHRAARAGMEFALTF